MSVKGEVRFEAAGKVFTAVFGFTAMAAMEAHFDEPFGTAIRRVFPAATPEISADPEKLAALGASIRVTDLGTMFGFSLMKHHGGLTEKAIDDLIDDLGLARATQIVAESLHAAIGDASDDVKGGDGTATENPPPRRRPVKTG
jgi:hypothetical protein